MHLPDGQILSLPVSLSLASVSVAGLGLSLWRTTKTLAEKQVPLLAVTAAFIFAAQMINFPILAGVSGHFLGALLAAILLGPYASFIVMTIVLVLQALIFKDGGLIVLGTNIFNMGFVGGMLCGWIFAGITKLLPKNKSVFISSAAVIAWLSVVLSSLACAVEIGVSGTFELAPVAWSMFGLHALIGIGEALISAAVLSVVIGVRPDLVALWAGQR
jgi:cobalt/nickel transport system permease protein